MALITFLNNERLTLCSSKLVYEPNELNSLTSIIDQADVLQNVFAKETEKVEAASRAGYDTGYEKGQTEGYEAALQHIAVKLVVLAKEANAAREELATSAGDIALKVVQKIAVEIGSPDTIAALAKSAAKGLVPREPVVLRVHPDHVEYLNQQLVSLEPSANHIVDVVADYTLTDTDCVLETEFGRIKANLQTQLKVLREKMYAS